MSRPRALLAGGLRSLRHPISQNAAALGLVQLATFVVPLVTLPYLTRTLGEGAFGLVVVAQGLAISLGILLDFGFNASASREVAAARERPERLAEVACAVLSGKLALVGLSLLIGAAVGLAMGDLRARPELLVLALVAAVAQGLTPGWFFFGLERLKLVSAIQLLSRAIPAALTFVVVHGPGDARLVLGMFAAASLVQCAVVNALLYRLVRFRLPRARLALPALRESWVLFVGTAGLGLYTTANVVLLGFFVPAAQVAHFGAAERIVRAAFGLLAPLSSAIYPRLSLLESQGQRGRARRLTLIACGLFGGVAAVITLALELLAPVVIRVVYGEDFEESVALLRLLAPIIVCIALSTTLGGGWMLSRRMDAAVVRCILRAAVLNLALAVVLTPLLGPAGLAVSVLCAELCAVAGCAYELRAQSSGRRAAFLPGVLRRRLAPREVR